MVPISLDFHFLRDNIRIELTRRLETINPINQAFDAGWLLYGIFHLGGVNGGLRKSVTYNFEKWVNEVAGKRERDLGALCLAHYLFKKQEIKANIEKKVKLLLDQAIKERKGKFKVLNDPEQFFCISLCKGIDDKKIQELIKIASEKATGRVSRKVLLFGAIARMGGEIYNINNFDNIDDPDDIITVTWYKRVFFTNEDISKLWGKIEVVLPIMQIGQGPEVCRLSNSTIALLSEAISHEISEPNANMIFELYPFAHEIKSITKKHFKQGSYVSAVFEATKKLNEMIQNKTNSRKNEAELVKSTMKLKERGLPQIQFNDYIGEVSGKNEQSGIASIAEGIFTGFRNPKGHKPQDHHLVEMTSFECLGQLIIIDYIWKRVLNAKIQN